MSQGESKATVPAVPPCSWGWEGMRGHLEREQPGAVRSAAVRGVKGSSGGMEWGWFGGGGRGLCRVRNKLSPEIQQGCLSGSCRCSAVAAGGHGRSSPACLKGP